MTLDVFDPKIKFGILPKGRREKPCFRKESIFALDDQNSKKIEKFGRLGFRICLPDKSFRRVAGACFKCHPQLDWGSRRKIS